MSFGMHMDATAGPAPHAGDKRRDADEGLVPPRQMRGRILVGSGAAGDGDDQVVCVVVRGFEFDVVEPVEHHRREPADPLVAVDQGVVANQRFQKHGGLLVEVGIGVGAEHGGLGPMHRGVEQADVADRADAQILDQRQHVFQRQVLDHWPSRSSRSAYRCRAPADRVRILSCRSRREAASWMARTVASCLLTPSASASNARACSSSGVSRNVMAIPSMIPTWYHRVTWLERLPTLLLSGSRDPLIGQTLPVHVPHTSCICGATYRCDVKAERWKGSVSYTHLR